MNMAKDLQAISKELTKLVKQIEKLAAELGKAEKPAAKSVKPKTKAKAVTKKAPAKGGKKTDTDKLLAIINRSKKGADTATLMKKTGFNQNTLSVYRQPALPNHQWQPWRALPRTLPPFQASQGWRCLHPSFYRQRP